MSDRPPDSSDVPDFAAVFTTHRLGLLRLATLLVGDQATAEDVVQDAFTALHRKWPELRNEASALPYARRSVVNGCRSVLRHRAVVRRFGVVHDPPVWSAESAVLLTEDRKEVIRALHLLPRRRREVLVLRYYADLTDAQIAEALGISEVTVRSTAARALAALGRLLGEEA